MNVEILKCHSFGFAYCLVNDLQNRYGFSAQQKQDLSIAIGDSGGLVDIDRTVFLLPSASGDARLEAFRKDGQRIHYPLSCVPGAARAIFNRLPKKELLLELEQKKVIVKRSKWLFEKLSTFECFPEDSIHLRFCQNNRGDIEFFFESNRLHRVLIDPNGLGSSISFSPDCGIEEFPNLHTIASKVLISPNNRVWIEMRGGHDENCDTVFESMLASIAGATHLGLVTPSDWTIAILGSSVLAGKILLGESEVKKICFAGNATFVFSAEISFDGTRIDSDQMSGEFFETEASDFSKEFLNFQR